MSEETKKRKKAKPVEETASEPKRRRRKKNKRRGDKRKRKKCGAKTRQGTPCQRWGQENGRCRLHGGNSTGPKDKTHLKGNQFAKRHGFYSKHLPKKILKIIEGSGDVHPADLLWDQIVIQYAAIIRAQEIMYVDNAEDHAKFITGESYGAQADSRTTEVHTSWDRYAKFLQAQSHAVTALRGLIKHYNDFHPDNEERELRLTMMEHQIEKLAEETKNEKEGKGSRVTIINDVTQMEEEMRKYNASTSSSTEDS